MNILNKFEEVAKADKPYPFMIPMNHLKMVECGWGNGYVAIPEGHPWFGKDYDYIDVEIYGGLTYSDNDNGMWVIGFDTAHYGDTKANCTETFVKSETEKLLAQVIAAAQI